MDETCHNPKAGVRDLCLAQVDLAKTRKSPKALDLLVGEGRTAEEHEFVRYAALVDVEPRLHRELRLPQGLQKPRNARHRHATATQVDGDSGVFQPLESCYVLKAVVTDFGTTEVQESKRRPLLDLAEAVIESDPEIDAMEINI